MKYALIAIALFAINTLASDVAIIPKAQPGVSNAQTNIGVLPDGNIVIIPKAMVRNGVAIPLTTSTEDVEKQREFMAKRKAERAANASKSASSSSSSVMSIDE